MSAEINQNMSNVSHNYFPIVHFTLELHQEFFSVFFDMYNINNLISFHIKKMPRGEKRYFNYIAHVKVYLND